VTELPEEIDRLLLKAADLATTETAWDGIFYPLRAAITAALAQAETRGMRRALRYTEIDGLAVGAKEYDLNIEEEMDACIAAIRALKEET
jgi:hypothetical protein